MASEKMNRNVSQMFATARIYCLISIVAAHILYPGTFAGNFWNRLGTLGVVLFLVMAGYFFRPQKFKTFGALLGKKGVSIGIPWLFLGSLTWLYNAILSVKFRSLGGYFQWIFGNGTYLYYLPVLFFCFLLFYRAPKVLRYVALLMTAISIFLTAMGFLDVAISFLGVNHYLNVFNWIGFFALGMILQEADPEKLFGFFQKFKWLNFSLFAVALALLLVFREIPYHYFSFVAIPYEILGGMAILSLSTYSLTRFSVFNWLSGFSFSIYLFHMIFIGLFDRLLGISEITRMLSPIVIIASCFLMFLIGWFLFRKLRLEKVYALLTGCRLSK